LSRLVIRDVVIPIVERVMHEQYYYLAYRRPVVLDSHLEEFLEEEMRRHFGVIGANECQHLREQLEEAMKNDPYAFEFLTSQLLKKYIKLATKLRLAKKSEKFEGPPDRFSELRKKYPIPHYE